MEHASGQAANPSRCTGNHGGSSYTWPHAVPITKFQSSVLRLLAAHRSPDSYVAGGVAINRDGPRISANIDIFHDSVARLEAAVKTDDAALTTGGYQVTCRRISEPASAPP
jgi:hypothetical protein